MKNIVMEGISRIAFDAITGNPVGKTKLEMSNAVRAAVLEACGGEWNYYKFMDNEFKVYAIISEVMTSAMNASFANRFSAFADFKDEAMGDKTYFTVEDAKVYPMYSVARGDGDVERQKIIDRKFKVDTVKKAIKLYEELDQFMAGRMDFGRLVEKATIAWENYIGLLISDTMYGSYAAVDTPYKATGAYDADTLAGIIEHVKAATSAVGLQIWGSSTALGSISDGFGYSDAAKDRANSLGYWGEFRGTTMFEFPQAYRPLSQTLGVNTAHIIILPADEKIIKVVFEGEVFVGRSEGERNDEQIEFKISRRVGAGAIVLPEGNFGIYKFT